MSEYEFYIVEKKPPLAYVYLNRPGKLNAMHPPAWWEMPAIMDDLDKDPEIRVVIIAGKGKCFSAGIDLPGMATAMPELLSKDQTGSVKLSLLQTIYKLQKTNTCIERCRKPVIAAIHGFCIGAGLDMATACDIRLCSKDAQFSLREAAVAFVADVGVLQRLPLICGQGVTRELAYTAKFIDAKRAREILLVSEVYDDYDAVMKGAEDTAAMILDNSPLAIEATKNVLNQAITDSIDAGLLYNASISANIIPSADLIEAAMALGEKRKPKFTGK